MAELLADIKTYLGVSGTEQDAAITVIINDGIETIDAWTGLKNDYYADGKAREMLFDFCKLTHGSEYDEEIFKASHTADLMLLAVRNYLDITWSDPAGDTKLAGIIARGMKYIDKVAGSAMDYTQEDKARELLFDYCRYVRSNALNEFQNNYLPELLSLQIAQEVAAHEAAEAADV
jgi:hypothetical protein